MEVRFSESADAVAVNRQWLSSGSVMAEEVRFGTNSTWHIDRQALHAEKLALQHPDSGETVQWHAPLPDDLHLAVMLAWPALAQEALIRKNIAERMPDFPKIDEVTKSAMPGLYEVRVNGTEILRRIAEHGVTLMAGAPAVLNMVLEAAQTWDGPIPGSGSLRVVVAGAPPPTSTPPGKRLTWSWRAACCWAC